MLGKGLPYPAVILFHRRAAGPGHAQRLQGDPLGIEQPKDIVIGDDEQVGRRAQGGLLVGQEPGIDVAVGADQGQVRHPIV